MIKIYKNNKVKSNHLKGRERNEGMSIEREMQLAQNNGIMPEKNMSSVFYTQKKDGILASTDIRTDKWDISQNAMEYANNKFKELREQKEKERNEQQQKIE